MTAPLATGAAVRTRAATTRQGELIGDKYVLGEVLGTGGMGVVYLATQAGLDRTVALKMLRPELDVSPGAVHRFRNEALAGARISHPNVIAVFDVGSTADGSPYLVMEHVSGRSLARIAVEDRPISLRRAGDLVRQILAALDEAHQAGVIHADVKSDNIIVQHRREIEVAKLGDFGLARFIDEQSAASASMISGTPEYLAPEVIVGAAPSLAADLYGVGVILYELIAGTTPFVGGTSLEILTRQLEEDVVPPSLRCPERQVPSDLERVVMRALEKDPTKRFPSATAFAAALVAATPASELESIATSSPSTPFQAEASTQDWSSTDIVALHGRHRAARTPSELREAVVCAIRSGDVDAIVVSYLDLSRALIDAHDLLAAASELEEGVTLLSCESAPTAARVPLWRLLLSLAAVYDGLGDPIRARRAAFSSRDEAIRAQDSVGQDRAGALIERIVRGPTPAALGAR